VQLKVQLEAISDEANLIELNFLVYLGRWYRQTGQYGTLLLPVHHGGWGASPADWRHPGHQIRSPGGTEPLLVLRQQFSGLSRGPYRVHGARKVAAATRTGRPGLRRHQGSARHVFVDRPSEVIDLNLSQFSS
jgi:hypothetical protein